MIVKLENDYVIAQVHQKGAELLSLISKNTSLEYMWSGDPVFWGKTSPVLFPIVGGLKGGTYLHKKEKYGLSRHGFARDSVFEVSDGSEEEATFVLKSDSESYKNYPFDFELRLVYKLAKDVLEMSYIVSNTDKNKIYFSIGGHPAFKVPLVENTSYNDYFLSFEKTEHAGRWPLNNEGLIQSAPIPFLKNKQTLPLQKELFYKDAIVLKHLKSEIVSLRSDKHEHGLDFHFSGFPFLGIWAAKDADFVCIEPWCGIADAVDHDQHLETKEGIESIEAGETWSRAWKVRVY